MIGHLVALTSYYPFAISSKPEWLKEGSYAEYIYEEYVTNKLVENGTYKWEILEMHFVNGELMTRINDTYILEWKEDDWVSPQAYNIPASGRIRDIRYGNTLLWLSRFYNDYLLPMTFFRIENQSYRGVGIEEVEIDGETKSCVRLTLYAPPYQLGAFYYSRETGILLKVWFGFRDHGTRKIIKASNITFGDQGNKAVIDLVLLFPFIFIPITVTLLILKKHPRLRSESHSGLSYEVS